MCGVDDRDATVAAGADGQSRAVGRQGQVARPAADRDPRLHFERVQIDDGHFVGGRQRDIGQASVGRDRDTARLKAQTNRAAGRNDSPSSAKTHNSPL